MIRQVIAVLILAASATAAAALDVVVLATGGELRGEVLGTEEGRLRLDLLPGEVGLSLQSVKEVRTESNPAWYLERIRGRNALTRARILDSALRSGCTDEAVVSEYVAACVAAAAELLADKRPGPAAEYCRRAAALRPGDARIADTLKRAEAAEHRAAAEAQALALELERRPHNAYARLLLGDCYRKLGRDRDAFAQYRTIIDGKIDFDGGIDRMEELRALIRANLQVDEAPTPPETGRPADGERMTVELPGLTLVCHDKTLAQELARRVPEIRRRVAQSLGCPPPEPCVVRVLPGRPEFIAATGNRFGDGYSSGDCIWTYHGAPTMFENIIPHEMAHVTLRRQFGKVPLWLDEGLAVRQEAGAGAYWNLLRQQPQMPIRELLRTERAPGTKEENNRFYASAYTLADMLINDGGIEKLHRLIAALQASSAEQAFREVYGVQSLQELEERWVRYLND